jgi:hypothetical protein
MVPASWATSRETPTVHRVVDARGVKRLLLFSGLYPIRMSVSEDDGRTWSELRPIGEFGGIVTMASVVPLRTGPGHYLAMFHDDGRFFAAKAAQTRPVGEGGGRGAAGVTFTIYRTMSTDGGLTWQAPARVWSGSDLNRRFGRGWQNSIASRRSDSGRTIRLKPDPTTACPRNRLRRDARRSGAACGRPRRGAHRR